MISQYIKSIVVTVNLCSILFVFTQCASSYKIDDTPSTLITSSYFQRWSSEGTVSESGFDVYFFVDNNRKTVLEEVYFKGKQITLQRKDDEAVYIGRYTQSNMARKDLVMSEDPKEEFGNELPAIEEKIPFDLKDNECMVGYSIDGKKRYFKIDNLTEKKDIDVPM